MDRQLDFSPQRTYANRFSLNTAIDRYKLSAYRRVVVYTEQGRCTAIFAQHQNDGLDAFYPARVGFMVFG